MNGMLLLLRIARRFSKMNLDISLVFIISDGFRP